MDCRASNGRHPRPAVRRRPLRQVLPHSSEQQAVARHHTPVLGPRGRRPLPVTGRAPRPVDFADTCEVLSRPNRAFEGTLAARFSARERGETACFGAVPQSGSPPGGRPIQPPGAPIASIETGKSLGQRSIYYIWRWKSRPGSRACVCAQGRFQPAPIGPSPATATDPCNNVQHRSKDHVGGTDHARPGSCFAFPLLPARLDRRRFLAVRP
jgi:hypothetical protein